jgi:hypothetical protein
VLQRADEVIRLRSTSCTERPVNCRTEGQTDKPATLSVTLPAGTSVVFRFPVRTRTA